MKISLEERIYGLSLLWKEASYNFAYWDERPELDWHKAYNEFLPIIISVENPYYYYKELQRFISLLHDGHSWVQMPDEICPPYVHAITTDYIDGKHILLTVPKKHEELLYSEIASINDIPIDAYLKKYVYPYIWHEKANSAFHERNQILHFLNQEQGVATIKTADGDLSYTYNESVETVSGNNSAALKHDAFKTMRSAVKITDDILFIDITADNIAYIVVPTFAEYELKEHLYKNIDLYKDCAGFLIDLRWNGGGSANNANALAQLFFNGKFLEPLSESPLYIANYGAYGQYRDLKNLDLTDPWQKKIYDIYRQKSFRKEQKEIWVRDCPAYLSQPVVILSSCKTASAAEGFLTVMKNDDRAVIVGTESYGSNGQPFMGMLPGGGRYGICTQKIYDVKGVCYNNLGIQPDIYIDNTIADHKNGYDAMFDKGLAVLRDRIGCVK